MHDYSCSGHNCTLYLSHFEQGSEWQTQTIIYEYIRTQQKYPIILFSIHLMLSQ